MDFLATLFTTPSIASTLLFLCLAGFVGIAIGKLEVKKIKLGIAGVLFSGIAIAHFGAPIDEHVLHFVREFGLILFVYSIGVDMGPRFFSSFKKDGMTLNFLAVGIVLLGFGIALIIKHITGLSPATVIGILCGAVTNTPSLGAAQQVLSEHGGEIATTFYNGDAAAMIGETGMAYAVAYPFGILGIIFTMILVRVIFRISIEKEEKEYHDTLGGKETKLQSVEITVSNPNLFGKSIAYMKEVVDKELAVSRIFRNNEYVLATDDEIVQQGDVIYGVSAQNLITNLEVKIGAVEIPEKKEITGRLGLLNILITNRKITGKTIEQIGIYRRYQANITRIYRNGLEILPTKNTTIELGDTVKVVGKKEELKDVKKELGDSVKELAKPNIPAVFIGIFAGVIVGSIPIFIPGIPAPAKLGLAGGPLVIAILLGYKGRIGKLSFYMTPGANHFLRELGIVLFLACVGLLSGGKFVETIMGDGLQWMLYGMIITFVPIMIIGIIGRLMKINYLKLCGCIAGSMTDPPALEFANSISPVQAQSTAYATVYPLTMFLRVFLAQIFILATL
ncbi:MAG: putative transporter [Bacteroidales bacterium]|jgi:putative transport protein|nr:putative transporter [Bacteroidales bacterium]